MNVAIIDDGVNPGVFINIPPLMYDMEVSDDLQVLPRKRSEIKNSHGTTCAGILCKYTNEIQLSSIKVLGDDMRGIREHMIHALMWCLEQRINLVHMSIGSTLGEDLEFISEAVVELQKAGIVIVASWSNIGKFTLPAGLPGVFSIKTNEAINEYAYSINQLPYLDAGLVACSQHTLQRADGCEYLTHRSNSYASPMVTAKVNELLNANRCLDLQELRKLIYFNAVNSSLYAGQWSQLFHQTGTNHYFRNSWVLDYEVIANASMERLANEAHVNELSIPVICIYEKGSICPDIVVDIYKAIIKEGYYAKLIHEHQIDMPYGEYLPPDVDIQAFLSLIEQKFDPSAILLYTNRIYPSWDVIIDIEKNDGYRLRTEDGIDIHYGTSSYKEMLTKVFLALGCNDF